MTSSLGSMDFFALEAGEYLERLGAIAAQGDPKRDEFVRFARALRGSALMANQADFAGAAGGLEAMARSYRDGMLQWDGATSEAAAQGIEDLKALLRKAGSWGEEETQQAAKVARELERIAGQPAPTTQRRAADATHGLNTGVRAFVAREGALIASSLERAGRALDADASDRDPIHNVVRRMQSLRGLAELTDLSPLPEMLEGLEMAAATLARMHAHPPGIGELFQLAAEAMTRASRDVAHQGRPDPEADEARRFSRELVAAFALESDVVPVEALAPAGSDSIVERGSVPPPPPQIAAVEVVSQGEHLTEMADMLGSAASPIECELRLFAVLDMLSGLESRIGAPLAGAFGTFAGAARRELDEAHPSAGQELFGRHLRDAGEALKTVADGDNRTKTAEVLTVIAVRLVEAQGEPATASVPAPPAEAAATTAPTREPADEIVSIADLAPTAPATPTITDDAPGLAGSFSTYHRLKQEQAHPAPSVAALTQGSVEDAPVVERTSPAPQADTDERVVSIDTLLYRGDVARERARLLGLEISDCLDRPGVFMGLRPLLEELLDLLPLADEPVIG